MALCQDTRSEDTGKADLHYDGTSFIIPENMNFEAKQTYVQIEQTAKEFCKSREVSN